MAKVFVSGQIGDIPVVQQVQAALVAAGHEITHDWTRNEGGSKMLVGQQTKFDQAAESARRATNDMNGVTESDVYVICTDNEKAGKGMYVELGGALALNTTTGSPRIYLLGQRKHATIFYFHPSIRLCESVDEIIADLDH